MFDACFSSLFYATTSRARMFRSVTFLVNANTSEALSKEFTYHQHACMQANTLNHSHNFNCLGKPKEGTCLLFNIFLCCLSPHWLSMINEASLARSLSGYLILRVCVCVKKWNMCTWLKGSPFLLLFSFRKIIQSGFFNSYDDIRHIETLISHYVALSMYYIYASIQLWTSCTPSQSYIPTFFTWNLVISKWTAIFSNT